MTFAARQWSRSPRRPVGGSARDVVHIEKMNGRVDAGNRAVTIDSWEPERRTFHVAAGPEPSLRVRTYFYPHWKAVSAGKTLPVSAAPDGTLLISAPAQAADIELVFQEPPRVHLFELVSALSWLLLIAMKYINLLTWPLLKVKLQKEYGPFYISVTIVIWSFVAAMLILAGAEWSARRVK